MLYLHEPATLCDSVLRGAIWAKAVGTLMELCLTYRLQHLQNTLLYDTVNDCGNTQRSCFPVGFWDFYPPYRAGVVPTELFLDKPDELLLLHRSQMFNRPLVHAGSTTSFVSLDCPICQLDIFLACH